MVGLPYPNMRSPELKEKMDYLNANMVIVFSNIYLYLSFFRGEEWGGRLISFGSVL